MDPTYLNNRHVLVTRPRELADNLCAMISNSGGIPERFPVIEIREPTETNSREFVIDNINVFNIAIFISPTAVTRTLQYLPEFPPNLRIAAIGSRTAESLAQAGIDTDILPKGHDSESLLALDALQADKISGQKIIIFRGEGGRTLLGDTLSSRGANVVYAEMYSRAKPQPDVDSEHMLMSSDIVATTSNEGLLNLLDMVSDKTYLRSLPLIVPGERCEQLARSLGFREVIVAENATDAATMAALQAWALKQPAFNDITGKHQ